ncbi:dTMP kinase [Aestuariibacter salexigens]|uniref:dTMP kinase n=1 Tax=Aestuariibacter salexigens TaxID=226010 RepID=UPI0003FFC18E|nr:dTMP kinase [Aestuariibacter salexigens]
MSAKCIVIEGLEGAGKSTAIDVVKTCLIDAGKQVVCTREPGGTPMAEAIRECVKHPWQEQVTVEAELMLMYAARAQLVHNVMLPQLKQGNWILADRHDMSSQAYQGGGRQIDQAMLDSLRTMTLKGFEPDLTIYLDVEPRTGLQRARGRGELDRIELEDISFFERTRERYLSLCRDNSKAVIIDTMQNLEQVHIDITAAVKKVL